MGRFFPILSETIKVDVNKYYNNSLNSFTYSSPELVTIKEKPNYLLKSDFLIKDVCKAGF